MMGLIIPLIALGVIYGLVYMPLSKGDIKAARNGTMISWAIAMGYGVINILLGAFPSSLFNFAAGAVLAVAWNKLK